MKVTRVGMKLRTLAALGCVVLASLPVQAQAQFVRPHAHVGRPAAPAPQYVLGYLWVPDASQHGQSHWQWLLHRTAGLRPRRGGSPASRTVVQVGSLGAAPLKAYLGRLPSGSTVELMWQFRKSDLDHQAGLAGLRGICEHRKIGLHTDVTQTS